MEKEETKKLQGRISELETKLDLDSLILESGTEGIGISNNGKIVYVNNQFVNLLGYDSAEELIGKDVRSFVAPQSVELVLNHIKSGYLAPYESFSLRKDGSEIPTMTFARKGIFQGESVRVTTIRDMTLEYKSRNLLEESETRFRTLFNYVPTSIWEEDASQIKIYLEELEIEAGEDKRTFLANNPDIVSIAAEKLKILDVNLTAVSMLNAESKEEILESASQFFTDESYVTYIDSLVAIWDKKSEFFGETKFKTKDNNILDIQIQWSVVPTHEHDYSRIITIITDITHRKQAENERQEIAAQIEQMRRLESLGILAGGIAHDFNNLLVGILGNASLALDTLAEGTEEWTRISEIEKIATRASDLTNQLLAYSGKGRFVLEICNLSDLINEMDDFLRLVVRSDIPIIKELEDDLPNIKVDTTQIRQVVTNLLTNSSQAIEDNEGSITIRTHFKANTPNKSYMEVMKPIFATHYIWLEVVDNGRGISDENIPHIFDPFYSGRKDGRGLGLSMVHGIARGHGCGIYLSTSPQRGTSLCILFPFNDKENVKIKDETIKSDNQDLPLHGNILIADDEKAVLQVSATMLTHIGLTPIMANDGQEAIDKFNQHKDIQLMILDLTMPNKDGETVYHEIRMENKSVPIIISSGYNKDGIMLDFEQDKNLDFLQKPYSLQQMVNKIKEMLS